MKLTASELLYLATLVDQDTTGNQDDPLYIKLMELYDSVDEDEPA